MEHLYTLRILRTLSMIMLLFGWMGYSQDIHFTFDNAQNTNDGSFDYYEVDIMIQTVNNTGGFKLGSGQLYFLYNTAAFGENVHANGVIEVTFPNPDYICGQYVDSASGAGIYGSFVINDNTTSRVSWAFSQTFSSSTFALDNVTGVPAKLCHVKIKYLDVGQDPMFCFESGNIYIHQFFTACGSSGGGDFDTADCQFFPGTQLVNDTYDCEGATLSNKDYKSLLDISVYPNPTQGMLYIDGDVSQLKTVNIYSFTGQHVMEVKKRFKEIDIATLQSGVYFLKLDTEDTSETIKIIKR